MKRSTDEIRFLLLDELGKVDKGNVESIRKGLGTGLPTVLSNAGNLEKMGFIKIREIVIGKRKYRELEITDEGRKFHDRLKKALEG